MGRFQVLDQGLAGPVLQLFKRWGGDADGQNAEHDFTHAEVLLLSGFSLGTACTAVMQRWVRSTSASIASGVSISANRPVVRAPISMAMGKPVKRCADWVSTGTGTGTPAGHRQLKRDVP
jgi:hypothetical protein